MVREEIGPFDFFKVATIVSSLPTTRSGKILRMTMTNTADGVEYRIPAMIDYSVVLE